MKMDDAPEEIEVSSVCTVDDISCSNLNYRILLPVATRQTELSGDSTSNSLINLPKDKSKVSAVENNGMDLRALYTGARITNIEAMYLTLELILTLKIPDNKIRHILNFANCFLPANLFTSTHEFLQNFEISKNERYFLCPKCNICTTQSQDDQAETMCTRCLATYKKTKLIVLQGMKDYQEDKTVYQTKPAEYMQTAENTKSWTPSWQKTRN
ncbi:uncharacterized protein LOC132198956 [Neocloeon triangulifer]|uniref:uncharacterized protein LOC132198956 n=1 Tax=Neocloeon triangulifer TaxID=2078957 RepID=UPI00286F5D0F|nr:uncharacterized protein LOC132198956 [Neocloeon triangulifer]